MDVELVDVLEFAQLFDVLYFVNTVTYWIEMDVELADVRDLLSALPFIVLL
jgi:hypothetical protein